MSYRRFTDSEGSAWEAWEVHPSAVERRLEVERRSESRDTEERRQQGQFHLAIPAELREGWLAFQGRHARARLAPIPNGWMLLSDDELATLMGRAERRPSAKS